MLYFFSTVDAAELMVCVMAVLLVLVTVLLAWCAHRAVRAERTLAELREKYAILVDTGKRSYASGYDDATALVHRQRNDEETVRIERAKHSAYICGWNDAVAECTRQSATMTVYSEVNHA